MVEIAIALGVIGFALVAIIGILPAGLQVQRDNRSETIINQDGTFWLETLRNGARGLDELINHVERIEVKFYDYSTDPPTPLALPAAYSQPFVYGNGPFTYSDGSNIVGLLTTPAGVPNAEVTAVVAAISGAAAEKEVNVADRELAFRYRMTVQIERPAAYVPSFSALSTNLVQNLSDPLNTLYELRLEMTYPYIRDTQPGTRRQIYRSVISRSVTNAVSLSGTPLYFFTQ